MKTRLLSLLLILTLAICMMIPLASCEKKPPRLPVNENGSDTDQPKEDPLKDCAEGDGAYGGSGDPDGDGDGTVNPRTVTPIDPFR